MDVARQKARKSKGSSAASSPDKSTSHAPAPTGAIPSDELKPFLLPDGPGLEALGMLPEPVRTATWMSCLFSPSAGTDLEQVVFWKLYQAQFSSFPQPLSDATKVVRAAESRYRPDKIEEKTAEGKMVSRYVLRDIQIRTFTARTMAMEAAADTLTPSVAAPKTSRRDGSSPSGPSPSIASNPPKAVSAPKSKGAAEASPSVATSTKEIASANGVATPVGLGNSRKRDLDVLDSPASKAAKTIPDSDSPRLNRDVFGRSQRATFLPVTTPAPATTPSPVSAPQSLGLVASSVPRPPSPRPSPNPNLLTPYDAARFALFPEPYRARLWLSALFEADTHHKGPGLPQLSLWNWYEEQFRSFAAQNPLSNATAVVKMVREVVPTSQIKMNRVEAKTEDGDINVRSEYLVAGIRIRKHEARTPALDQLLAFGSPDSSTLTGLPPFPPPLPPILSSEQVIKLAATMDSVAELKKDMEEVKKALKIRGRETRGHVGQRKKAQRDGDRPILATAHAGHV